MHNKDDKNYEKIEKSRKKRIIIIKKKKHRDGSISFSKERLPSGTSFSEVLLTFRSKNPNYLVE